MSDWLDGSIIVRVVRPLTATSRLVRAFVVLGRFVRPYLVDARCVLTSIVEPLAPPRSRASDGVVARTWRGAAAFTARMVRASATRKAWRQFCASLDAVEPNARRRAVALSCLVAAATVLGLQRVAGLTGLESAVPAAIGLGAAAMRLQMRRAASLDKTR